MLPNITFKKHFTVTKSLDSSAASIATPPFGSYSYSIECFLQRLNEILADENQKGILLFAEFANQKKRYLLLLLL